MRGEPEAAAEVVPKPLRVASGEVVAGAEPLPLRDRVSVAVAAADAEQAGLLEEEEEKGAERLTLGDALPDSEAVNAALPLRVAAEENVAPPP
jgi:hypothetical protein